MTPFQKEALKNDLKDTLPLIALLDYISLEGERCFCYLEFPIGRLEEIAEQATQPGFVPYLYGTVLLDGPGEPQEKHKRFMADTYGFDG